MNIKHLSFHCLTAKKPTQFEIVNIVTFQSVPLRTILERKQLTDIIEEYRPSDGDVHPEFLVLDRVNLAGEDGLSHCRKGRTYTEQDGGRTETDSQV